VSSQPIEHVGIANSCIGGRSSQTPSFAYGYLAKPESVVVKLFIWLAVNWAICIAIKRAQQSTTQSTAYVYGNVLPHVSSDYE
jgi:hypothetical protein